MIFLTFTGGVDLRQSPNFPGNGNKMMNFASEKTYIKMPPMFLFWGGREKNYEI